MSSWRTRIDPVLKEEEVRHTFDLQMYGEKILGKLRSTAPQVGGWKGGGRPAGRGADHGSEGTLKATCSGDTGPGIRARVRIHGTSAHTCSDPLIPSGGGAQALAYGRGAAHLPGRGRVIGAVRGVARVCRHAAAH